MKDLDSMTKQELLAYKHQLTKDISKYKNLQLAKKVQLNSAYGAIGNAFFRFFDVRMAEAITLSGQLSIRWIEARMNEYLNRLLDTDSDYVIAIDTDSIYVNFESLVQKVLGDNPDELKAINFLDKVAKEKIEPFIDKMYQELADRMNAFDQKMIMKREVIANKGIWTAKKRYMLNVFDNEGVRYAEPKLKMMGIETVKSSTPAVCRDALKKAINIIMSQDEAAVQEYIAEFRETFKTMPFEDIAFPRSVSEISKYKPGQKGIPIHVRGSMVFNRLIKEHDLGKTFETVKDGTKIKFAYMVEPNPTRSNVLAVVSSLPKQFGLEKYIDYDLQFNKSFLEPLKAILDAIDWSSEKKNTLEAFFG